MSEFMTNQGHYYEAPFPKGQPKAGEIIVVKIGGSTYEERAETVASIALLSRVYHKKIVAVHGGGKEIDQAMEAAGIEPRKVNGIRYTDEKTLKIVTDVLEVVNRGIRTILLEHRVATCGFLPEHGLLRSEIEDPRLGFVGGMPDIDESELNLLQRYVLGGTVPVVCPIAVQKDNPSQGLNVNADLSAGALAAALGAKFVLLTDKPGVLDENGKTIKRMIASDYDTLKEKGVISGGMLPKIQACLPVVHRGGLAIICNDIWEAFSLNPRGTIIQNGP